MEGNSDRFVIIPSRELSEIKAAQDKILSMIERMSTKSDSKRNKYITAQEFMDALSISRSLFDLLRDQNKINVIQKRRKLYLPENEIERYMKSETK